VGCGKNGGVAQSCDLASEICCVSDAAPAAEYECVAPFGACIGGTPIRCDEKADCQIPGQVCCGTLASGGGYTSVECSFNCTSVAGITRARFCNPNVLPSECPSGTSCKASQSLAGFFVCRP
jgi:hypothetical protein